MSNEKSINNNNNNKNSDKNKIIINHIINAYNTNNKNDHPKVKNLEKKLENNILNLIIKKNNDNHINNLDKKENNKNKNDDSFLINKENNNNPKKNCYNTKNNSTKNISNNSQYLQMNSSEFLLNLIKNKTIASKQLKHNKNKSMTDINTKHNNNISFKNNKENKTELKEDTNTKSQEKINTVKKEIIKDYYGPIDIGFISFKNKEESIDDIINQMEGKGFEYKKINSNLIKFNKRGKIIEIEIVKIKRNLFYYLTKKIH